jgi:hypothetical protein
LNSRGGWSATDGVEDETGDEIGDETGDEIGDETGDETGDAEGGRGRWRNRYCESWAPARGDQALHLAGALEWEGEDLQALANLQVPISIEDERVRGGREEDKDFLVM